MKHEEEARAKLLNEVSELVYSAHHNLNWVNFTRPHAGDLGKISSKLKEAMDLIQLVLDDNIPAVSPWKLSKET